MLQGYLFLLQPVLYRFAAAVHVGRGFEQEHRTPFYFHGTHVSQAARLKGNPFLQGQAVQNLEADIVAGMGVFRANIAQAGYQVLFHRV